MLKRVKKQCATCRYFVPKSGIMGDSICLRYPRQPIAAKGWVWRSDDIKWAYPSTQDTDVCGEWVYNDNDNDSESYKWRWVEVDDDDKSAEAL